MDLFDAAGIVTERRPIVCERAPNPYRDAEFDADEIAWFTTEATVDQLKIWHLDMLECDDAMKYRSRRTRQLREIVNKRGLVDQVTGNQAPAERHETAGNVIPLRPGT